eukprot:6175752-Pleurochrysis_carterae.AAC.3
MSALSYSRARHGTYDTYRLHRACARKRARPPARMQDAPTQGDIHASPGVNVRLAWSLHVRCYVRLVWLGRVDAASSGCLVLHDFSLLTVDTKSKPSGEFRAAKCGAAGAAYRTVPHTRSKARGKGSNVPAFSVLSLLRATICTDALL